MFHINVWLTVKDAAHVGEVRTLLAEAARLSRAEQGCCGFEVYHSQSDKQKFLLSERWESEQAWQNHRSEKAFTEIYQPKVLPLVEREPHICEPVA